MIRIRIIPICLFRWLMVQHISQGYQSISFAIINYNSKDSACNGHASPFKLLKRKSSKALLLNNSMPSLIYWFSMFIISWNCFNSRIRRELRIRRLINILIWWNILADPANSFIILSQVLNLLLYLIQERRSFKLTQFFSIVIYRKCLILFWQELYIPKMWRTRPKLFMLKKKYWQKAMFWRTQIYFLLVNSPY